MTDFAYVISCHDTHEYRALAIADTLEAAGLEVRFLFSDFLHREKKKKEVVQDDRVTLVPLLPYKRNLSLKRIKTQVKISEDVARIISSGEKPALVYCFVPPNSLVNDLLELRALWPDLRICFDLIDMWPESLPFPVKSTFPGLNYWRKLRDKRLWEADYVFCECGLYYEYLNVPADNSDKTSVLHLSMKQISEPMLQAPCMQECCKLCYLGAVGNIIDIERISEIIHIIPMPVELHIIGDGINKSSLVESCEAAGASVVDHGIIYDENRKGAILAQCHFGLNVMKSSVCVGLSTKSVDYFMHALPVINTLAGDTWQLVEEFQAGINYASPVDVQDEATLSQAASKRENAYKLYIKHFSPDAFDRQIKRMLSKVFGKGGC